MTATELQKEIDADISIMVSKNNESVITTDYIRETIINAIEQ